jgi:hypothetical protein
VPQQAGRVFTCDARLEVGTYPVRVTETDGAGRVSYASATPLVVLDVGRVRRAIEASIFSERHLRAMASCPAEVLQRAGIEFKCTARIRGRAARYPVAVSEIDDAGHVRYVGM